MSPDNEHSKDKFVGRKTELEQFELAIRPKSKLKSFLGLGDGIQPRVFLPYGIGGMGKTWLSKECLKRAKKAGWETIEIDWERADYLPSSQLSMMDTISECIKQTFGEKSIQEYLKVRRQEKQVKEKVRRLKQENQEKWLKFVDEIKSVAEGVGGEKGKPAAAVISLTGSVVNALSVETAKAEENFLNWLVETGRIGMDDGLLYADPQRQLARKLVEAIKNVASSKNLLILFDTCEILSANFEVWLRDAVVCPAIETGASLIFIVTGRLDQYHERQITLEDGSKKTIKGYADRISNPPPIAWDMSRFAKPEIEEYLQNYGLEPQAELVEFVQGSARGVPYAVQIITGALMQLGIEKVREKFPPNDDEFSPQEMLIQVTRRFLRYCMDDDTDYYRIQSLAILRNWDAGVLQTLWHVPDEKAVNAILHHLEVKYGFVLPDRKLHEIVRDFVREDLRLSNEATARDLGKNAKAYYLPVWEKLSADILSLEDCVIEPRWRDALFNLLNTLYWHNEQEAINFLAARVMECLLFDKDLAKNILETSVEFSKADRWISQKNRRTLNSLKQIIAQNAETNHAVFFITHAKDFSLESLHLAIVHTVKAEDFYHAEKYQDAFEALLAAEREIKNTNETSVPLLIADQLENIGWKLGVERGLAKPSQLALQAIEHAVQLAPERSSLYVSLGVIQYGLKLFNDALISIQLGISMGEESTWAYNWLGNIYASMGNYDEAIATYQQTIHLDPKYAYPHNGLGNVYRVLQRYDEAIAAYQQAIYLNSKLASPHSGLGNVYRDLQRYDEAIAAYQQAIHLDPKLVSPQNGLGNVYNDLQRYDEAIAAYQQVIHLDPKLASPHNGLGNVYRALERYDEAIAAYQQVIHLDPKYAYPHNGLGNVYNALERYDEAIAAYQQAIHLDPKYAYPYNGLGNVYNDLQRYDEAIAAYQQAIHLDPKLAYPYNELGNVYRDLQRYDEAIAAYQQAIHLDPKLVSPQNGLGNVYNDLQRYDEAIAAYQQVIHLDPKYAHPHNGLGNVYNALERYDEAIAAYQQAIHLDPKDAYLHKELGNVYSYLQRYDEAVAAYQQAIQLNPKLTSPHNGLGIIYNLQGEYQKGLIAFQRAVELAPEDGSYHSSLVRVLRKLGREQEAQAESEIARKLIDKESEYNRACFEAICGNADEALHLLKVALEKKEIDLGWARLDPDFETIRDDPRFRQLVGLV